MGRDPGRQHERHDDGDDDDRHGTEAVGAEQEGGQQQVSGRRRRTTVIAPMPMAMAGTSVSPGRCDKAMPPAVPMKMAGNTGPPRKLLSETP
jgi:hypothetical protein